MTGPRLLLIGLLLGPWLPGCSSGSSDADGDLAAAEAEAERLHAGQEHERSAAAFARAAALAREAGDLGQAHRLAAQRAVCLKLLGRTAEARAELLPALAWARENGDMKTEGLALGNLARVEALDGHDPEALAYLDELADFTSGGVDTRTEVLTLEQAGLLAMRLGDVPGGLRRLERALAVNDAADLGEDDRHDGLIRERARGLLLLRDDEGAWELLQSTPPSAAGLATEARLLSEVGLSERAADVARAAAHLFAQEGEGRQDERDRALTLHLSELLEAGRLDEVTERLANLSGSDGDPAALVPFRVIEARQRLIVGDAAAAVDLLTAARGAVADERDAEPIDWLLAYALVKAARPDEALELLDTLPHSLATTLLGAWLHVVQPPESTLVTTALPRLDPRQGRGNGERRRDASLKTLRKLCPERLPTLAWSALHHHLADADRIRASGREEVADRLVLQGIRSALQWQALETVERVLDHWPDNARMEPAFAAIERWIAGELSEDEAVIVAVPGERHGYLVVCTAALGGTTLGLPPVSVVRDRMLAVCETLRGNDVDAVTRASSRYFDVLFEARAREDLAGLSRWTLVLPDELLGVPPAMLVSEPPVPGGAPAWLVLSVDVTLLPCAPLDGGREPGRTEARGAVRVGEPDAPSPRAGLAAATAAERFGASALQSGPLRRDDLLTGPVAQGSAATAAAVGDAAGAAALELSAAGVGGGRLGGLFLAPDAEAERGDARLGFLPWHRLAELSLPPTVICDRVRFDPSERDFGPGYAAAACQLGGAHQVLLTRWPLPAPMRRALLTELGWPPRDLAAVPALQRAYLEALESAGASAGPLLHPRSWAGWLPFAGP